MSSTSRPIHRRVFLRGAGAIGLSASFSRCGGSRRASTDFEGRVAIVGAGAAGMSAGHMLAQRGVDFQILEAASTYGGRIKRATDFVDFPIPLGAEWLHEPERELTRIVDDPGIEVTTEMRAYRNNDSYGFYDGELSLSNLGRYDDLKFVGGTWLDFYETYLLPSVASRMRFDTEIVEVDYSGADIVLTDTNGASLSADRVIVTVPLTVLQKNRIRFTPELPSAKREAITNAFGWGGMKVFVEFSEAFYPTLLELDGRNSLLGQHLYFDASYGQRSDRNVLALFSVGTAAEPYQMRTEDALASFILDELDPIFDGAPTRSYVQHVAQDWSAEPFIELAYLFDGSNPSIPTALWEPVDGRVYFAGEAYTRHGDWGAVDDAARAARDAVAELLRRG
ncbi:MAG: FAD-dependent oxidoreductase [Myxococcota bacterium]